ncbi:DUF1254 domain-containing protein [Leifsonia xyli]|uniref:DUF1254 domain-containing protein n=1 Tax=Leifsonia xyli TaxID=1575 RepID=UPI003D670781
MTEQLTELATEAYVVGFPLVFDLEQVVRFTQEGIGGVPATPYNAFGHARRLAGPEDTFVSINNDTLYSIAQVDLGVGPIRLSVPEAGDRYYVLQFVDAWTNNFAYIGTRATGGGAGEFLLLPPDAGDPDGRIPSIRFPTRVATIVGRWAVDGEDDLPAVHALQDALGLTPVDETSPVPQGFPPSPPARMRPSTSSRSSACGRRPSLPRNATARRSTPTPRSGW